MPRIKVPCSKCGAVIRRYPSQIRSTVVCSECMARVSKICGHCLKEFWVQPHDVWKRKFCSIKCRGAAKTARAIAHATPDERFKRYMYRTRFGRHRVGHDIDIQYLAALWEKQNGQCALTGLKMDIEPHMKSRTVKCKSKLASLDRIDSTKGYVIGNVQFVCLAAQYAKHDFTMQEMVEFFNDCKTTRPLPIRRSDQAMCG